MFKRKDPPSRMTYLFLIVLTPCLILSGLWKQGDLNLQTASVALTVNALFYVNLKWIQDFFRAGWGREYEEKLAFFNSQLARDDLSSKERVRLERKLTQLPDRYHLVTSQDATYRKINVIGTLLGAGARVLKAMMH
ncbi:hypothetical protein DOZ80_15565 [Pseudomonas fluorescens]|uniref:Uncharacterized protein n=1 Tax=Pseudomonas fluorescens TaxID=294 RepID=A0A327N5N9_PSEFL|nr:hypothetical protein [Pseudomonas fluorescens]RAI69544.1 hypothetical protein DOZ80_15565 [Pseudomonas fluorescens]